MFTAKKLFNKALMLELPWYIDRMNFEPEEDKVLGINGSLNAYDTVDKVWRHLNFFKYECLFT